MGIVCRSTSSEECLPFPSLRQYSRPTICPDSPAVYSKYLMNDIPRGTTRAKLINFLHREFEFGVGVDDASEVSAMQAPQVDSGCIITDSRLDDELSVAVIEFSDTPKFLQLLNARKYGFPKKTDLGTLWKGVDTGTGEIDANGQSEFIRAAIAGDIAYAETLAEFRDTDVNVQDKDGRTALHWACAKNNPDLVGMCLSILECDIGLRDNDGLTAFDLSLRDPKMVIPDLFYQNVMEMDNSHPRESLFRMLTMTSQPAQDKAVFPGEAIFAPIEECDKPLVKALLNRGIDLTARGTNGDTALHLAVKATDVEIAIRLLSAGSDVDAVGEGGATPLHCAAQTSEKKMVQALLSWEAKPDMRNEKGETPVDVAKDPQMVRHELLRKANDVEGLKPLQRAAEDGELEVVRLLLDLGACVDENNANGSGQTALMVAARMGHQDVAELLVKAGADVDAVDRYGRTPLDLSSTEGFTRLLRDHGATLTAGSDTENTDALVVEITAIDFPTEEDDMIDSGGLDSTTDMDGDLVTEMIESRPSRTLSPLLQATYAGDLARVRLLLTKGIDLEQGDKDNRTPLYFAAFLGNMEIVQELLASGANIEAATTIGRTPLHVAVNQGHTEIVQALLASGAKIDARKTSGETPLYSAASNGNTEIVQALLASGARLEAATNTRATPLHVAAVNGHTQVVQALLASRARLDAVMDCGLTPLYLAAAKGQTKVVQALLASGAQLEAATQSGATPLYAAAQNGGTKVVQALLASGARLEVRRSSGETPLITAAKNGHAEIVQELLASGAQIKTKDYQGKTALAWAIVNKHAETARVLRVARGWRPSDLTSWVRRQ